MTGKDLKNKLELTGIPLRQIAEALNISEQNLQNKISSADIKVSFLCKVSRVLHKSIYFFLDGQDFYKETFEGSQSKCSPAIAPIEQHNESHHTSTSSDVVALRLMDTIKEKDAKIDQLQFELRTMEKDLATFKAKYPEPTIDHPEGLGSSEAAKDAHTRKRTPGSEHYTDHTNPQMEK